MVYFEYLKKQKTQKQKDETSIAMQLYLKMDPLLQFLLLA